MRKARINVSGRVQGVGFRYMTKLVADQLGVYGSVKNEQDGSVTIEAIADNNTLDLFVEKIKHSPSPSGRVDNFSMIDDDTIKDSLKFNVTY
ncbi:acylphosphatase [Vagococcus xieshaowenii]|uniref:acylphosphatase n=1 Tax=Vagococcus xieshaowenii TaxID=2562451 RepID=A0AAJ5JLI9_9ENTE|nr:acylphosphatase [Vagococcus xieshaowenii]QCA28395.1 acylphosphatase [Vagococcus xieshaowenii]TFZ42849.1 acylphosphatase [Vagococcus xieshaowenii]